MKILQLAPRVPFPLDDGGKIGIANIFYQFEKLGNEVKLIFFEEDEDNNSKYIDNQQIIAIKHSTKNNIKIAVKSLSSLKSMYLYKHWNEETYQRIKKIAQEFQPDVVHCDHTAMASYGQKLKSELGIPFGLRLHNVEHLIWKRYSKNSDFGILKRIYAAIQAKLLKKEESALILDADCNFTITKEDSKLVKSFAPNAKIVIASAGVDTNFFQIDKSIVRNPFEMILATTYSWEPNIIGLMWFIENVMPLIKNQIPQASLTLLGKNAPNYLFNLKDKGINCLGYVDDVRPYLNSASIYISPLFVGGGIRIKILEAMAMGLTVISTKIGAEGILKTANSEILASLFVTDSPSEQAEKIISFMNNQQLLRDNEKHSFEFVENNFSWRTSTSNIIEAYSSLNSM